MTTVDLVDMMQFPVIITSLPVSLANFRLIWCNFLSLLHHFRSQALASSLYDATSYHYYIISGLLDSLPVYMMQLPVIITPLPVSWVHFQFIWCNFLPSLHHFRSTRVTSGFYDATSCHYYITSGFLNWLRHGSALCWVAWHGLALCWCKGMSQLSAGCWGMC